MQAGIAVRKYEVWVKESFKLRALCKAGVSYICTGGARFIWINSRNFKVEGGYFFKWQVTVMR